MSMTAVVSLAPLCYARSTSSSDDIVTWVGSARRGDKHAFNRLYRHYFALVHGIALVRVPYGDVEDVVQDVFTIAWRRRKQLRRARAFRSWLAQIARRQCQRHLERRGARAVEVLPPDIADKASGLVEALNVLAVLNRLPLGYREILVLRFVEGLPCREVASMVGMTYGSTRVKVHRGLEMLRGELGGYSCA